MSERSLFQIRYAFPGYSFLGIFILSISVSLWKTIIPLNSDFFNLVISMSLLLGGAPIGFFVSQLWYIEYDRTRSLIWTIRESKLKKYMNYLVHEIDEDIKINIANEQRAIAIYDYIIQTYRDESVSRYQQRRWDLYHTMGSTKYAIFSGFLIGVSIKILMTIFGIKIMEIGIYDMVLWAVMIFFSAALCTLLDHGMNKIINEHEEMAYLLLTQIDKEKIREIKRNLDRTANQYFIH